MRNVLCSGYVVHEQHKKHCQRSKNINRCYWNAWKYEKKYNIIADLYRKAAEQGYAEAEYKLGDCYKYGSGVEQSYEEAIKWYKKAAEKGQKGESAK